MSKSPYSSFKTSENCELSGIWLEEPEFRVRLARAGGRNKAYAKSLERHFRVHRRAVKMGKLDPAVAVPLMADVFIESVIKQWQVNTGEVDEATGEVIYADGIHNPHTDEVEEVTPETIKATLLHPDFGDEIFGYIQEVAGDVSLYLEDVAEEDVKN